MTLIEGLVILAALVMLVLLGHGLWLVWRSRPRDSLNPSYSHSYATDPAFEHGQRIEPLTDLTKTDPNNLACEHDLMVPYASVARSAGRIVARIDPMIDAVATIALDKLVLGEVILAHMPSTRRVGNKSLLIEGLNYELTTPEPIMMHQTYSELHLGLQMANRMGVLNEIEYSEFVHKSQKLAEELSGVLVLEDMTVVVARARELDQFAQAHDAQLVVNLMAQKTTWSIGYIQQVANRHGFVTGSLPGVFVVLAAQADAPAVVTLAYDTQVAMSDVAASAGLRQISLTFDVAQHSVDDAPFALWQRLSLELANELDAVILDDTGQTVGAAQFAAIEQDLQGLYQRLAHYELPAGSPAARRLFS